MRTYIFILVLSLSASYLSAQVAFGCLTLDFESLPGTEPASGVVLSDQYKSTFGVSFSLEGGGNPILAGVGPPREAFQGPGNGSDNTAVGVDVGNFFLTDDGILANIPAPPIVLTFDIPIDTFGGCILDMDGNERFEIEARDEAGNIVISETIVANPAWGDGSMQCWGFNLPGCVGVIKTITYRGTRTDGGGFGLGMDYFSFCYTAAPLEAIIIPQTCEELGSIEIPNADGYQFSFNGAPFTTEAYWDNLIEGAYEIEVMDAEGCISDAIPAFIVELVLPDIEDVDFENTSCGEDNGTIEIDAGTTQGPSYSLDGINFQASNVFDSLPPDIYTVYVQDSFGCVSINGAIIEPSAGPEITLLTPINDECRSMVGTITVEAEGTNLMFSLDEGANFQSENLFTGLSEGDYEVLVMDEVGCTYSDTISLTTTENVILQDLIPYPARCNENNGYIEVLASGGEGEFTYNIEGGPTQTDSLLLDLLGGTYTIIVTDENGCTASGEAVIEEPDIAQIVDVEEKHTICNEPNGALTITSSLPNSTQYSLDGVTYTTENFFAELEPGPYTVYIKDENDCLNQGMANIAPSFPLEVESSMTTIDSCEYAKGTITVTGTSANSPISYSLNGGEPILTGFFENLSSGSYQVNLTDSLGCQALVNLDVANTPGILIAGIDITPPECYEDDGIVEIIARGGYGELVSVLLDSISQPLGFENLYPGNYELTVMDELGCIATREIEVPYPYCPIYIPNVISHQEQNPDDLFRIFTHPRYQASVLQYRIYDRWGELVYISENFSIHTRDKFFWDGRFNGKDAEQDAYTYLIEVRHPNSEVEMFAGSVMLLR